MPNARDYYNDLREFLYNNVTTACPTQSKEPVSLTKIAEEVTKQLYRNTLNRYMYAGPPGVGSEEREKVFNWIRNAVVDEEVTNVQLRNRLESFLSVSMENVEEAVMNLTFFPFDYYPDDPSPGYEPIFGDAMITAELQQQAPTPDQEGEVESPSSFMSSLVSSSRNFTANMIGSGGFISQNIISNIDRGISSRSISFAIGPIPIPYANYIEVARSGKVLKIRATGSIFMAHQEGSEDAIRIEGTFPKEVALSYIMLIWALFLRGRTESKSIQDIFEKADVQSLGGQGLENLSEYRKINDWSVFNSKQEEPQYEWHRTFAFVTPTIIIPNTYIETFSFEDTIESGKDAIQWTIVLRTYTKPDDWNFFKLVGDDRVYASPDTEFDYTQNLEEQAASGAKTPFGNISMMRVFDFSLNVAWRMFQSTGIMFPQQEWKVKTLHKARSYYYNIDAEDVITTVVLGLYGLLHGAQKIGGFAL